MVAFSHTVRAAILVCVFSTPAWAQFKTETAVGGPRLDHTSTQRFKVGIIIKAVGGSCKSIVATAPVPVDWPEQQVKVIEEDVSPSVGNVRYRMLGGTVKQMLVEIPSLGRGQEAKALVTLEISRSTLAPPEDVSVYLIPKRVPRELNIFLGPSPQIESRHPKIVTLAKEIVEGKETAWAKVEAIYDWVREHVEYKNGALKGAVKALQDKSGDCEELSSLFIALCRASKIPARTVWVPGHCYPEFYLVDDKGKGHWFPCQAAGTRAFGGIAEQRPILQKGDNFKDPERPRERQRYLSEFVKGSGKKGGGQPKVTFVRELIGT